MHRARPTPRPRPPLFVALLTAALALAALASCVPGAAPALGAPTFRLRADDTRIVRLDPPGAIGDGALVVRVALRVANPNPVGIRLDTLEGQLWLGGIAASDLRFVDGVDLPARGEANVTIDVGVPLERIAPLVGVLGDAIAGRPVAIRLDAEVGVGVLGVPTRFPRVTVARGELRQADLVPMPPRVRFDAATTGVREARFDRITIAFGLAIDNPGPLGFVVRAPDARLRLGGREVASVAVPATALPAGGSVVAVQEVVVNPVALGVALATQLQALAAGGAAAVDAVIVGRWELDLGILGRWTSPAGDLVTGRVD
jgi:hypothetical protein